MEHACHKVSLHRKVFNVELPNMLFHEGMMFYNLLNELASQGFFVISNGGPNGEGPRSTAAELIKSLNWATKNPEILKKYGNVDLTNVIAAGQSCGTSQAVSSWHYLNDQNTCTDRNSHKLHR
jgi:hypothetical protein